MSIIWAFCNNSYRFLLNFFQSVKICFVKGTVQRQLTGVESAELGTRYFFPGSLIAKSLFHDHGSLSLNR